MAIKTDHAYEERVEGDVMPSTGSAGSSDNYRVNNAMTMAPTSSDGEDTVVVHEVDTYKYAPEWIPSRAFRVTNAPQSKEQDPGTK